MFNDKNAIQVLILNITLTLTDKQPRTFTKN